MDKPRLIDAGKSGEYDPCEARGCLMNSKYSALSSRLAEKEKELSKVKYDGSLCHSGRPEGELVTTRGCLVFHRRVTSLYIH